MKLEQEPGLLEDMCGTPLINDQPDSKTVTFKNHFDSVVKESDVQEKREVSKAQEPIALILSDDTMRSLIKTNQDCQPKVGYDFKNRPLSCIHVSS